MSGEGAARTAAENKRESESAAQQQRDAEARRQANIAAGKSSIDSAFGRFDDGFFDKYRTDRIGAATPQIQDQYATAKDKLFAQLTDRGVAKSSIAGGYYKDLEKTRGLAEGAAANDAADAVNALRNSVQAQKNSLYSLNSTGADPSTIATQAIGSATAIAPNQNYTALGDLFSGVLNPLTKAATAYNYSPYIPQQTSNPFTLADSGRVRVVS